MKDDKLITRRATVDDLPQLIELWDKAFCPADIFEKRLTEFHLVEDAQTKRILASIGIHPENTGAMIHSEVFGDPLNQDLYRDMLWPRFQILSRNLGVSKIWTQETADFGLKWVFKSSENDLETLLIFLTTKNIFPGECSRFLMKRWFRKDENMYELLQKQHDETEAYNRQLYPA